MNTLITERKSDLASKAGAEPSYLAGAARKPKLAIAG